MGSAAHLGWTPAAGRKDPTDLLIEQNKTREPDLVPVCHGRMMVSPFTFYRGAAKIMASDLATTPTAGLEVQLCGDAHLSNLGLFASPERTLLFDVNDFDETLPGPFEWDVKRMAASFVIAGRNNRFRESDARDLAGTATRAYREAMASFAEMRTLDVWYARLDEPELLRGIRAAASAAADGHNGKKGKKGKPTAKVTQIDRMEKVATKTARKARTRDSLQELSKLAERVSGTYQIVNQPPLVVPVRELQAMYGMSGDEVADAIRAQFQSYHTTLDPDRRELLERFEIVDVARKVVGVGSVGTRAFIALLQGRDQDDPLFLQVKEATASVLEPYLSRSRYRQHGARVVHGQRMMQAASDIFLGWTKGVDADREYYWRQLRDMKGSAEVETMTPTGLTFYAQICGWTLARAHARSGDPVTIAAYLGDDDMFDRANTDFSTRYADQNERDFQQFTGKIRTGEIEVISGV